MSGEAEPRRSVRATKGQHTKSFDQLDAAEAPTRRGKRAKKAKTEEPEEEIIRCVCGATEQEEDSGEPWIACDKCTAWQHNVCMGMSVFNEDLPKHYYCELCGPDNHKELLAGIANGEKPWEARRQAYQEEQESKKKKGRKGGRGKRTSDQKDKDKDKDQEKAKETKQDTAAAAATRQSKTPPAQEAKRDKDKKESAPKQQATGKRKARDEPGKDGKVQSAPAAKLQKVSETKAVPTYSPPADLPKTVADLAEHKRHGTAKLLIKAMTTALGNAAKGGHFKPTKDEPTERKGERLAFQIERAVWDTHPDKPAYTGQCKTLAFNIKANPELCERLLKGTLTPDMLAVMSTGELATKEQQRETAEMIARAEKQSILINNDEGPRVRKTHKGEEFVEDDNALTNDEAPTFIRRPSVRDAGGGAKKDGTDGGDGDASAGPLTVDTQPPRQSPSQPDFDINKVLSSVRSPTSASGHLRRLSATFPPSGPGGAAGPGVDPDVDRLLQDDNDSPPYSPTEETDPDVVWRGNLFMNSLADMPATIKFAGGANLPADRVVTWSKLIPKRLSIAGRIDKQKAIEYLCGLRYVPDADVVVTSISPVSDTYRPEFDQVYRYFSSKNRYGVVGDKGVPNVRDTYVVPVAPGEGNLPEFMYSLATNLLPDKRTEPMILVVLVYRDDAVVKTGTPAAGSGQPQPAAATMGLAQRVGPMSGPAFSPTSPQGPFPAPAPAQAHGTPTPLQRPSATPPVASQGQPPPAAHLGAAPMVAGPATGTSSAPVPGVGAAPVASAAVPSLQAGQKVAAEVLGSFIKCATVQFLLPQAHLMSRVEWELIRDVFNRDPKARDDLPYLSNLLEKAPTAQPNSSNTPIHPPSQGQAPLPPPRQGAPTPATPAQVPQAAAP